MTDKRNIKDIEQDLRDLAVDFDGKTKIVRIRAAAKIIGYSPSAIVQKRKLKHFNIIRIFCERTRRTPKGFMDCWKLGTALRLARQMHARQARQWNRWTESEEDQLKEMLSCGMSYQAIAAQLDRTVTSVRVRCTKLQLDCSSEMGLYNTWQAGKLLGVRGSTVYKWTDRGLKYTTHGAQPTKRLVDLRDLRAYLEAHVSIMSRIKLDKWSQLEALTMPKKRGAA